MKVKPSTIGERLFEEYLLSQGMINFEYEKSHESKSKRPDYFVHVGDKQYIFEVKDIDPPNLRKDDRNYDVLAPIREKINRAAKQFKEYKKWPCCLVLYNNGNRFVPLEDPLDMLGTMNGDPGATWNFDLSTDGLIPGTIRLTFGDNGKMIRPKLSEPQNTTISALITLRYVAIKQDETKLGVIVWENRFARVPFPRELFCGPYDERYVFDGDRIKRAFVGRAITTSPPKWM